MIYILLGWFSLIVVGHFVYGLTNYVSKIIVADAVVKNQSKAIFHYISILYVILFMGLIFEWMGKPILTGPLTLGLGLWFLSCGGINFYYGLKIGIFKMFQWVFFLVMGVLFLLY